MLDAKQQQQLTSILKQVSGKKRFMEKIQTLRGFRDILGDERKKISFIENISRRYLSLFGFSEITIPVLEKTELFIRSIGDATDIVEKEMFTFTDRSGESVSLRPEATAGMVRAYLQEGLYTKERVSKLFTIGPMFRHERPQKGRFREFHQINVEVFGVGDPLIDAELLWVVSLILNEMEVSNYNCEVNSVGCSECREGFKKELIAYFKGYAEGLCDDCVKRLQRNPLRIFDCKNTQCTSISKESPLLFDHLCMPCREHFERFLTYLKEFNLFFTINKRLVRGLDYYTKTVFEFTSDELGAQKAFVAGGRYDNLIEGMGGPATPGCGFAIGMERLALLVKKEYTETQPNFFFAYVGEEARTYLIPVLKAFSKEGLRLRYSYEDKSLKSQMRYADSLHADYVLILGDEEIGKKIFIVRDMKQKRQSEMPLDLITLPQKITEHIHR